MDVWIWILSACAVAVAGSVVYLAVRIGRTAARAEELLAKMDRDLPPLLAELNGVAKEVGAIAERTRSGVDAAAQTAEAVRDVAATIDSVNRAVRFGVSGTTIKAAALAAGIKAGISYFFKHLGRKR
ncbi:MAG: DUF948 domain-containing protein [Nitrospirae bacterium]|nr:DUF948 domain-containing protein [Nitrospirota bacterium]MBI3391596.1 DUF948 domain-containing protein [Nitrospirota bacterium]